MLSSAIHMRRMLNVCLDEEAGSQSCGVIPRMVRPPVSRAAQCMNHAFPHEDLSFGASLTTVNVQYQYTRTCRQNMRMYVGRLSTRILLCRVGRICDGCHYH